ncbi:ribosomal large subunit pseudouridine synthase D [Desulfacinum hydrothermale DSM 13146]|uniref:Ribosomal large subunit pseudouridine synthase D n=1 Tax=Desulfacinum hydrothermale DSM 13146 TaxID=1121390 RepID=A0A1W1XH27_9BACT|nr:RNA pseudouridine synthase [Desulfacinum hydrothermale]SMC23082.1 ribosomal large subunit pseudouridine synthase D [Desulfacinum hydrothermale DSM 13146]
MCPRASNETFFHPAWPVFHEDNHVLAVYKPAGLLVQGDRTGDPCLLELAKRWIKERYQKPGNVFLGLVHRLDRPVSGALIFAKTSKAASRLSRAFREQGTLKEYLAVVEGQPKVPQATLVHHLCQRPGGSTHVVQDGHPQGRRACLHYRVLGTEGSRSLVAVRLETGRKHQIRVQLAAVGCPIAGDLRYGALRPLPNRQIALHAWRLVVPHPTRSTSVEVVCPLPRQWPWDEKDVFPDHPAHPFRPLWAWSDYERSQSLSQVL